MRLIDKDGKQVGVVTILEALDQAKEDDLDLVEISPKAETPVCKIIDYGKYRYQLTKKERDTYIKIKNRFITSQKLTR